jgi:hypothetical protein
LPDKVRIEAIVWRSNKWFCWFTLNQTQKEIPSKIEEKQNEIIKKNKKNKKKTKKTTTKNFSL